MVCMRIKVVDVEVVMGAYLRRALGMLRHILDFLRGEAGWGVNWSGSGYKLEVR